jgi:SAM-dependent methyltransferase
MNLPDYFSRINPDLLRLMPPGAQTVLEVGCGAGALAEAYRRINPRVRYFGVEKSREAAEASRLSGRLDQVICGDIEVTELTELGLSESSPTIDCLVFGDVLEHLVDPWATLARLTRLVRTEGQILACIPNVQHYSVLLNLLRGRWEYQDDGLLDRTHLRFFTLQGIQDLFAQAGLKVFDVQPRWWPDAGFDQFQKLVAPLLSPLAIDTASFAVQSRAVQYIVRSVRESHTVSRMFAWSLLGSTVGSDVRIGEPNQFLATIPGVRVRAGTQILFDELAKTWPGEARVFIEQRVIIPLADHERLQRALLAENYLIVGEFDDDPDHFPDLARTNHFALRSCHCLQTTTEVMAETLRRFNPHVAVFPNAAAALAPPRAMTADLQSPAPVTLFFGALNREPDWAPIMPELNRVLLECGERVRVQVVYDRAFFDALEHDHKVFEPLASYTRYHELLHQADLALLPLEPTRFNEHKSDLKFLECGAHGVAALASVTVYGRTINHGETGLLYRSTEDFSGNLRRLIDNVSLRHQLGANARHYVAENRMLSQQFHARYEWYGQMSARLAELNAELAARVPELIAASRR